MVAPLSPEELRELRQIILGEWKGRESIVVLRRIEKVLEEQKRTLGDAQTALGRAFSYFDKDPGAHMDLRVHLHAVGKAVSWWLK